MQHSDLKLRHVRVQRRRFQRLRDGVAGFNGIDNLVDPQSRRAITRVGLLVICLLYGFVQCFLFFFAQLFATAFQLAES